MTRPSNLSDNSKREDDDSQSSAKEAVQTPSASSQASRMARGPHVQGPGSGIAGASGMNSGWIAEVSHELRLPLANIKLLVETLLDGALEEPETSRRMLKRAHQEVERLHLLVRDLMSIEQIAQSRNEVTCQWVQLADRAKYAADSITTMALSKNVSIEIDSPVDWSVYANPSQLDQVLLNLVENAVKFTPQNGSVIVRSGPNPGSFSVIDTGIGIPAHEIPKIFQRFYRVDRTQSKGSTGLGLSIVKNILDLHGAKISVSSKEGAGTTFSVEFPSPRLMPDGSVRRELH